MRRPTEVVQAELDHVRWLLSETERWDGSLNSARAVGEFYERQRQLLVSSLSDPAEVASVVAASAQVEAARAVRAAVAAGAMDEMIARASQHSTAASHRAGNSFDARRGSVEVASSAAVEGASARGVETGESNGSVDGHSARIGSEARREFAHGGVEAGESNGSVDGHSARIGSEARREFEHGGEAGESNGHSAARIGSEARREFERGGVEAGVSSGVVDADSALAVGAGATRRVDSARASVAPASPRAQRASRPSRWQLTWKPFLHESLGWFIGAFLILSGALYLVADAWDGMTSATRSLTIFGLLEGWTLGFVAWAAALSKKNATAPAAVGLRRIAALVAPLSALAVVKAPAGESVGVLAWLALALGVGVAAWLARRAAHDSSEPAARLLSASVGSATLLVGLTPVLPSAAAWLALVPVAFAALAFRAGPRASRSATVGAVTAFLLPVALVLARFTVAFGPSAQVLAAAVVGLAVLAAASLSLRSPGSSPGALGVLAAASFVVTLPLSFLVAKPACVLVSLLGAFLTWRLSREATTPRGRWWLAGTWVFSFLSWQRADQLVPAVVWAWWNQLKLWLGYAAAPMPASYGSVYQSLFIVVSLLAAAWVLRRQSASLAAHVWLRCSAIAAGLSALLAMVSVQSDPRPALVALPLLLVSLVVVGLQSRRVDALASLGVVSFLFTVTLATWAPGQLFAVAVPLGLALGAHTFAARRADRPLRWWLGLAALASALLVVGVGAHVVVVHLAVLAAVLAGRVLHRGVFAVTLLGVLPLLWRLDSPMLFALAALGLAALSWARGWRIKLGELHFHVAALLGLVLLGVTPLAAFAHDASSLPLPGVVAVGSAVTLAFVPLRRLWWLVAVTGVVACAAFVPELTLHVPAGWTWLVAAAAALVLSYRFFRPALIAVALTALVAAVFPLVAHPGLWPGWSAPVALAFLGAFSLAASVHAVRFGRSWQGVLFAALSIAASFTVASELDLGWVLPALTVLAATPALLAWVTVPVGLALLVVGFLDAPGALLAVSVAGTVLALAEEWDWSWRVLLNRAPVAWVASAVSAGALLTAALVGPSVEVLPLAVVVLPFAWARATRNAGLLAAGVVLSALVGPWWLAPAFAVLAGRAPGHALVREALGVPAPVEAGGVALTLLASTVLTGVASTLLHGHALAWAAAVLLLGGGALAVRVALAAGLAALLPASGAPLAVGGLVALAALARQTPLPVRRVLGADSLAWVEPTSLLLSVFGALWCLAERSTPLDGTWPALAALGASMLGVVLVKHPLVRYALNALACLSAGALVSTLGAAALLPATLVATGLMLGVPVLFGLALVAGAVDAQASVLTGALVLTPVAWLLAVGGALAALALRSEVVLERLRQVIRRLGREGDGEPSVVFFWAAFTVLSAFVVQQQEQVLWVVPLLLLTPRRREHAPALALFVVSALAFLPATVAVSALSLGAVALAVSGTRGAWALSSVWRVAAAVVAVLAIGRAGVDLSSPLVPLAWAAGAATTWVLLGARPERRGWAWAATSVALHVVMGSVGVWLSTGAPKVLIFPWWAAGTAALALVRHLRGGRASVWTFSAVSLVELLLGVSLLASAQPREAVLSVLVAGVLAFVAWRRVVAADEAVSAWVGQLSVLAGALAVRVLGAGGMPGLGEAWVLLGAAAVFSGLVQLLKREGRAASAGALTLGATWWPLLGFVLVPWGSWGAAAGWLLGWSVLGAWLGLSGLRRRGAAISALALNLAVLVAAIGSGFGALQLALIPFGLSLLVLTRVFRRELSAEVAVHLRAWGMGFVYAAVAWEPLTVTSVPALVLCVVVCLAGVTLGAVWRVRSYVVLGTGVLVTTVSATLVRSGLAEPRLGAVFLSLLGLAVVGVMVVLSTRRAELELKLLALRRTMATWTP